MSRKEDVVLTVESLGVLAKERLEDARILVNGNRMGGAVYVCGYAIELALKKRICITLGWAEYPSKDDGYRSFKTHDLEILLHLSGVEKVVKGQYLGLWSIVNEWSSDMRYSSNIQIEPKDMIEAAGKLLEIL